MVVCKRRARWRGERDGVVRVDIASMRRSEVVVCHLAVIGPCGENVD